MDIKERSKLAKEMLRFIDKNPEFIGWSIGRTAIISAHASFVTNKKNECINAFRSLSKNDQREMLTKMIKEMK